MLRVLTLLALLLPTAAFAETTYLPGGRLGLDLPPDFEPAKGFPGFANLRTGATFLLIERPREAWARLRGSFTDTNLKAQGIVVKKRETLAVGDAEAVLLTAVQHVGSQDVQKWIMIVGDMTVTPLVTFQVPPEGAKAYPPDLVRKALLSLKIRAPVSLGEQISSLPLTFSDTASYRVDRTIERQGAILVPGLSDGPMEPTPIFLAVAMPDRIPAAADMADTFARQGFMTIGDTDNITVDSTKQLDFDGQAGHEAIGHGVDRSTGKEVVIVQWLRPVPGAGLIRYVGIGPSDARDTLMADFTRIRDGITPKAAGSAAP